MENLSNVEIELVGGGDFSDYSSELSEYWQDQLLRYKTGLSSVFGPNPDFQGSGNDPYYP